MLQIPRQLYQNIIQFIILIKLLFSLLIYHDNFIHLQKVMFNVNVIIFLYLKSLIQHYFLELF